MTSTDWTQDSIWNARIRIEQPAIGYRFGIDAVLLAHFVDIAADEEALEIGSGSGVVTILIASMKRYRKITAVEIQPRLADLSRRNVAANDLKNVDVLEMDAKNLPGIFSHQRFDLIFSNPPYRKAGSGKLNPDREKAVARHEIAITLSDLFACASTLLKPEGRLITILPWYRFQDFDRLRTAHNMHYAKFRKVLSFATEPPAFFLSTLSAGRCTRIDVPDLILYDAPGHYSEETASLLRQDAL